MTDVFEKPKLAPPGWTVIERRPDLDGMAGSARSRWCFVPVRLAQVVVASGLPPPGWVFVSALLPAAPHAVVWDEYGTYCLPDELREHYWPDGAYHLLPYYATLAADASVSAEPHTRHRADAAVRTLENARYEYLGGEVWRPPLGHNPIPEIDALRERIRTLEAVIDVLIKLQVETLEFNERVSAAHETARRILGAKLGARCGTCGKGAGGGSYAGVPMCFACYESVEGNPAPKPDGGTRTRGGDAE